MSDLEQRARMAAEERYPDRWERSANHQDLSRQACEQQDAYHEGFIAGAADCVNENGPKWVPETEDGRSPDNKEWRCAACSTFESGGDKLKRSYHLLVRVPPLPEEEKG